MNRKYWTRGLISCVLLTLAGLIVIRANSTADHARLPDYPVYFCDAAAEGELFVYHPITKQLESLIIPWQPQYGITAAADGRRLYLAAERSIIVLDTGTYSVIADLPYKPTGPVAVSPDNRLVAVMSDSLLVLRSDTYDVVFSYPTPVRQGAFSEDSHTLSCAPADSSGTVLVVQFDRESPVVEQIEIEGGRPGTAIPVMNGQRILVYLEEEPMLSRLAVIDRLAGDEIYSERIFPGEGDIVSTAGWDRAIYTNSGDPYRIEGSSSFKIFDIAANRPVDEIITRRQNVSSEFRPCPVGPVQITPDRRWLIALSRSEPQQLFLYDLQKEQFADWQEFDDDVRIKHLSVQLQP